jgi:hypothetical protein
MSRQALNSSPSANSNINRIIIIAATNQSQTILTGRNQIAPTRIILQRNAYSPILALEIRHALSPCRNWNLKSATNCHCANSAAIVSVADAGPKFDHPVKIIQNSPKHSTLKVRSNLRFTCRILLVAHPNCHSPIFYHHQGLHIDRMTSPIRGDSPVLAGIPRQSYQYTTGWRIT